MPAREAYRISFVLYYFVPLTAALRPSALEVVTELRNAARSFGSPQRKFAGSISTILPLRIAAHASRASPISPLRTPGQSSIALSHASTRTTIKEEEA